MALAPTEGLPQQARIIDRFAMASQARNQSSPLVDVVVPARNEANNIERCLKSIEAQEYRPLRVLVVDGCSDDGTAEICRSFDSNSSIEVVVITNEARTIPAALNLAMEQSRSDFFVRLDAHAEMRPGYLDRCVELLTTGEWAGAGGPKLAFGQSEFGKGAALAFRNRFISGGSYYHFGTEPRTVEHIPFGAYRTDWVRKIGGWNQELAVNQDFEFDHRLRLAGGQLRFHPALATDWRGRETPRDLAYQYFRYGRGKYKVVRMHPSSVKARQLAPVVLLIGTTLGLLFGAARKSLRTASAVPSIHIAAVLAVFTIDEKARRAPAVTRVTAIAASLTMHWSWGCGFIAGALGRTVHDPFHSNPDSLLTGSHKHPNATIPQVAPIERS